MKTITSHDLEQKLDYPSLIEVISEIFARPAACPERSHHTISQQGKPDSTLLMMPAWQAGEYIGVKIATIFPLNGQQDLPAVMATYLLMSGSTGEPLATVDGKTLTSMRTAATSALASGFLSRTSSRRLLVVGAGDLCAPLVKAHAHVRQFSSIEVWNRTPERAHKKVRQLQNEGFDVQVAVDLEMAVRNADIVSCATLSRTPLIMGDWLKAGSHLDLIGAYAPDMRESDARSITQAHVFVDTQEGALNEAGDLIQTALETSWTVADIEGDLFDLTAGRIPGRQSDESRTVFKSVGAAIEDLAGAILAYERTIMQRV